MPERSASTSALGGAPRLPYAPGLDGLRALAVAAVVLYHGGVGWASGGFLGVDVFFVLSGFLITSLLLVERDHSGSIELARFWLRRARRLLPAALTLIGVCLLVTAVFMPADLAWMRGDSIASALYFNNWHQIIDQRSYFQSFARPSLLQHLWSLSVEEQFYLLWPPLLLLGLTRLRRGRVIGMTAVAAVASAVAMGLVYQPGADPSAVYYDTGMRAFELLAGALLAFGWSPARLRGGLRRGAAAAIDAAGVAGLVALGAMTAGWTDYDPGVYRGGLVLASVAALLVIAAAVHPGARIGGLLGREPLRWAGKRSYSIYLWHWPVMAMTRPGIDLNWNHTLLLVFQIALSVGLAELSYRFVEAPFRSGRAQRQLAVLLDRLAPRQRLVTSTGALVVAVVPIAWALSRPAANGLAPTSAALTPAAQAPPGTPVPGTSARTSTSVSARTSTSTAANRVTATGGSSGGHGTSTGRAGASFGTGGAHSGGATVGGATIGSAATGHAPAAGTLAVGESVMLAARPELLHALGHGTVVDAAIDRQPDEIISRLDAYRRAGTLPQRVIVQLGDNGPLWSADAAHLRAVLKGVAHVVLVNVRVPRSWEGEVNNQLRQLVSGWPQATIADWYDASSDPSLLYDGIHPDPDGQRAYARVIVKALRSSADNGP